MDFFTSCSFLFFFVDYLPVLIVNDLFQNNIYLFTGHKDSVSCLALSADGQLLASVSLDGPVQVWDISSGSLKCTLEGPGGGIEVASERTFGLGWFIG
ncbi:hypothetical protein Sjap_009535 [Stephania japonica]|uniref:Uncharacterized protein n=1 Tax=Stephania japonica TaxID=461633 RepID=A0AAP0PFI9_9MAGN